MNIYLGDKTAFAFAFAALVGSVSLILGNRHHDRQRAIPPPPIRFTSG
ncbi:MAG: hypothetical protein U0521_24555 [Anaerolineae bacterium]